MKRQVLTDFLNKPFRRKKLFRMMERIMGMGEDTQQAGPETYSAPIATQFSVREELKHSVRILLAEDNPVNQKLAKLMLTKAGYHVAVANDGREAVDKYTTSPADFDLIFMDIQMPEMDGLEATKAIRERESQNSQESNSQFADHRHDCSRDEGRQGNMSRGRDG